MLIGARCLAQSWSLGQCIIQGSNYYQLHFSAFNAAPCIYKLSTTDDDVDVMQEDLANTFGIKCDSDVISG